MNHRFHLRIITTFVFLLLATHPTQARRIVTLVTIHGEANWNIDCILGGSRTWQLVPHTPERHIFTDLILGFDEARLPETEELPHVPGQGSIAEIAKDEGWVTAFFSARDTTLNTVFAPLYDQFTSWTVTSPGFRNWDRLNDLHGVWLATQRADRFSWIHLALADLPVGGGGSSELYRFWVNLSKTLEALSAEWALFTVFIPMDYGLPWNSSQIPLVSFRGTIDTPPENIVLSTLDITPTLAHIMRFLNTPDYRGQSLALWKKIEKRVEPLPILINEMTAYQGTRIIAFTESPVDDQMTNRIQFYDLWTGRFTSCLDEAMECSRLSGLLAATEEFHEQMEGSVSTVDRSVEENGEQ